MILKKLKKNGEQIPSENLKKQNADGMMEESRMQQDDRNRGCNKTIRIADATRRSESFS